MRVSPGGGSKPSPRFLAVGGTRSRPPAADCADLEVGGRAVDAEDRRAFAESRSVAGRVSSSSSVPSFFSSAHTDMVRAGRKRAGCRGTIRSTGRGSPGCSGRTAPAAAAALSNEQGQEDVRRIREVHAEVPAWGRHHAAADVPSHLHARAMDDRLSVAPAPEQNRGGPGGPRRESLGVRNRVNGRSHPSSDLDLVLRAPGLEPLALETLAALSQAFEDSTIPFFVEARDWARLPESFRAEIERDYVVVVRAG